MSLPRGALPGLAFAACVLIWGSTWLFIKLGYEEGADPFHLAGIRFLLAAGVLFGIARALRVPIPRSGRPLAVSVFVGAVLFGGNYGLVYWGEQYIQSGTTAVLFATMPLFVALLAHRFLPGDRLTWRKLLGIAVGIGGTALLFLDRLGFGAAAVLPMVAIVVGALCAALVSVTTKKHGRDVHPAGLNAVGMLVGAALLFAMGAATPGGAFLPRSSIAWVSIGYLALAGSVATFLLYFWLLKLWPATRMSFIPLLTPVIALGLGVLFTGEALTLHAVAGAALILIGVAVASLNPPPQRPARLG